MQLPAWHLYLKVQWTSKPYVIKLELQSPHLQLPHLFLVLPSYFTPGPLAKNRGVFPVHSLPLVPNIQSAKQSHETDPEKDSSTSSQSRHHHLTSGIRRHVTYSSLFLHPASPLQSILLGFPELLFENKSQNKSLLGSILFGVLPLHKE